MRTCSKDAHIVIVDPPKKAPIASSETPLVMAGNGSNFYTMSTFQKQGRLTSNNMINEESQDDNREYDAPCGGQGGEEADRLVKSPTTTKKGCCWRCWCQCRCRCIVRLVERYAQALDSRPLVVKCITSTVVGGLGDVIAQSVFFWTVQDDRTVWHEPYAMRQVLAVVVQDFFVSAPSLHFVYEALDRWWPANESVNHALTQVFIDVFVLNPIYALAFIIITGFLEGKSMQEEVIPTVQENYGKLVICLTIMGLTLAPLHVYLFHLLSVKWRVLISDGIDLLWTFLACFAIQN